MRSVLTLVMFGALVSGHVQAQEAGTKELKQLPAIASAQPTRSAITPETPVISIKGLCNDSDGAKSAADCRSEITRAQFESLVQFVQPAWSLPQRRQFAAGYAEALVLSEQAHKMGLDSGPRFETLLQMQREFVLQYLLTQALEAKAADVPDAEIAAFYNENKPSYEEVELARLYVPLAQHISNSGSSSSDLQKRQQESLPVMKKVADELRERAVKGEDFSVLQTAAYKAARYTLTDDLPGAQTEKRRRKDMPATQVGLMDLAPGQVSQVFDEPNGHFVYKVISKHMLTVQDVRPEIVERLRSERLQKYQREAHEAASATLNETYFRVTAEGTNGNINNEP